jgi:hypothetical protein
VAKPADKPAGKKPAAENHPKAAGVRKPDADGQPKPAPHKPARPQAAPVKPAAVEEVLQ